MTMSKIVIESKDLGAVSREVEAECFICGAMQPNEKVALAVNGTADILLPLLLSITKDVLSHISQDSPLRAAFFAVLFDNIATPEDIDIAADMIKEMTKELKC